MMDFTRLESLLRKLPIRHRDTGRMTPFILNPNQKKALQIMQKQWEEEGKISVIILKSRRVGMSSLVDAILFVHALANPHAENLIVAHVKDTSEGLFRVPRDLARAIAKHAPRIETLAHRIVIHHSEGDSILDIATAGSVKSGRGLTLSGLHLSEVSQYPGEVSFSSLLPAVSKGKNTIRALESTAFGKVGIGAPFYNQWKIAESGRGDFVPIFLSWLDDPACVGPEEAAKDAPATDLERELMKDFGATRAQIAWMRSVYDTECQGIEKIFLTEYPHCLAGDTLVATTQGTFPIKDLKPGMSTGDGEITAVMSQGVQPVVELKFASGRRIVCTPNHRFELTDGSFEFAQNLLSKSVKIRPSPFASKMIVDVRGDVCISVKPAGATEVWDISVSPTQLFSANGLSSHNSPNVAFQSTGDPAFTREELVFAEKCIKKPAAQGHLRMRDGRIEFERVRDGKLQVWREPVPSHRYYLGVDAAVGVEWGDFASATVYDGTDGELAAQYDDRITPELLAYVVNLLGRWYNKAMMAIELTGNSGREVQRILRDKLSYPNWYYWKGKDDKIALPTKRTTLGFEMTSYSRPKLFDTFRMAVRGAMKNSDFRFFPRNAALVSQMEEATMSDWGRWEVERGHDDVLVSTMLAVLACAQYPPPQAAYGSNIKTLTMKEEEAQLSSIVPHIQDDTRFALRRHWRKVQALNRRRQAEYNRELIETFRLGGI